MMLGGMPDLFGGCVPIVDVRDTANIHLQAIKVPEGAGKRFLAAQQGIFFKDLSDHFVAKYGAEYTNITTKVAPDDGKNPFYGKV